MDSLGLLKNSLLDLINQDPNWLTLFQHHGWNTSVADLKSYNLEQFENQLLNVRLSIDRTDKAFEEFNFTSERLISPGKPGASFLYHAFASPCVVSVAGGDELIAYPTWAQIDILENAIYALKKADLQSIVDETQNM